jgi:hypothetical protein
MESWSEYTAYAGETERPLEEDTENSITKMLNVLYVVSVL